VGDRVKLGGIKGDVIDIGVLRTTLMEIGDWVEGDLYNGRIVRIANSFVFKSPVFNYSADFPFLWDEIRIPVQYGSDYRQARQILLNVAEDILGEVTRKAHEHWRRVARKYLIEDARVDPMVTIVANDNWVEFTLRYVVDYKKRRSTQDELFITILEASDHTGGRIAIASTTLKLVDMPSLQVHLSEDASNSPLS
jgi:small-conductance mechanosensitive channel